MHPDNQNIVFRLTDQLLRQYIIGLKYMIADTEYQIRVPGTRFWVPCVRYGELGARYETKIRVRGIRTQNTEH